MPYVQRDGSNNIIGVYQQMQSGYAEEFLAPNDPEIIAFRTPSPPMDRTPPAESAANTPPELRNDLNALIARLTEIGVFQ